MSASARAAVLSAPGNVQLVELPPRAPGPGEVRVAVDGCGVCGSNLPVWEGRPWFDYPRPPGVPGHEAWGRVVEAGPDVVLEGRALDGPVALVGDGCFASEVVVGADAVVPLPPELDGRAFPGEAFGSAWNVAARAGFAPGQTVAVVGIGFIGAVVTALAAHAGAHVVAISRRQASLELARTLGAKEAVPLGERSETVEAVTGLVGAEGCEVVVEAVGLQAPLDLAGDLTAIRGRLVVAGFHQDGPRTVDLQGWNWKGIDVVNAHERDPHVVTAGIRAAAAAVADGTVDLERLVTHRFALDDLAGAMDAMVERPEGFVKAVVLT